MSHVHVHFHLEKENMKGLLIQQQITTYQWMNTSTDQMQVGVLELQQILPVPGVKPVIYEGIEFECYS